MIEAESVPSRQTVKQYFVNNQKSLHEREDRKRKEKKKIKNKRSGDSHLMRHKKLISISFNQIKEEKEQKCLTDKIQK